MTNVFETEPDERTARLIEEGIEEAFANDTPIDALSHSNAKEASDLANDYATAVENAEYIEYMADRFGVGGRY